MCIRDSCGRIPLLVKRGFKGEIYCTDATADLVEVMLKDSGYIHEKEAEWKNRKNERAGRPAVEPVSYTHLDVYKRQMYKTVGIFVADECSPRFDQTNKEGLPWVGFKNMEQISDKPTEVNFENMYKLMRDYPDHVMVASIMGSSEEEWKQLAKMCDELGCLSLIHI